MRRLAIGPLELPCKPEAVDAGIAGKLIQADISRHEHMQKVSGSFHNRSRLSLVRLGWSKVLGESLHEVIEALVSGQAAFILMDSQKRTLNDIPELYVVGQRIAEGSAK